MNVANKNIGATGPAANIAKVVYCPYRNISKMWLQAQCLKTLLSIGGPPVTIGAFTEKRPQLDTIIFTMTKGGLCALHWMCPCWRLMYQQQFCDIETVLSTKSLISTPHHRKVLSTARCSANMTSGG